MNDEYTIHHGDALSILKTLESESVQCCVTSPPYFGLRDYSSEGQIGLEKTPQEFVAKLVDIFREVRRVLKKDGVCWLNLGDSYSGSGRGLNGDGSLGVINSSKQRSNAGSLLNKVNDHSLHKNAIEAGAIGNKWVKPPAGFKAKDLMGIPWRVAFALQDDGWYLRQDIIWAKPNPMPESVTDRCTKAHEYMFLLTKSPKYFYDNEAIKEPSKWDASNTKFPDGWDTSEGGHGSFHRNGREKGKRNDASWKGSSFNSKKTAEHQLGRARKDCDRTAGNRNGLGASTLGEGNLIGGYANKRSVWHVATQCFKESHFATFPEKLIEPCILAGSREGDVVLDPFNGAATTGVVSLKHRRKYIGVELNEEYIEISERRLKDLQVKLF